jgi:hypothetical protein
MNKLMVPVIGVLALSACGQPATEGVENGAGSSAEPAVMATIPAALLPFGEGYPRTGDPCRKLGESDAVRNWLDDSTILIGCPTQTAAAALNGKQVGTVDGVSIVSVARAIEPASADSTIRDGLVPGTRFDATTEIVCSFDGGKTMLRCQSGVVRAKPGKQSAYVTVIMPKRAERVLSFENGKPLGADGNQADGSAGYDFKATRDGDTYRIEFGPEWYEIPDALLLGG